MAGPRNRHDGALLALATGPGTLAVAVAEARRFALDEGLDGDCAARLAIVVEEIVANVLDHAVPIDDVGFTLELTCRGDVVTVVLTDPGAPYDPRLAAPPADPPPARGGGAGLALVRAWCRSVGYERRGGHNRLILELDRS